MLVTGSLELFRFLIDKDLLTGRPLLRQYDFARFCQERGVQVREDRLIRLDQSGDFQPIVKVWEPNQYVGGANGDQLWLTPEDGKMDGAQGGRCSCRFARPYVDDWLANNLLWTPSMEADPDRPEWWSEPHDRHIIRFYSEYQIYALLLVLSQLNVSFGLEEVPGDPPLADRVREMAADQLRFPEAWVTRRRQRESHAMLCQLISRAYRPNTQGDRKTIWAPDGWKEFRAAWDARKFCSYLDLTADSLLATQESVLDDAKSEDPLRNWYGLVSFISVDRRKRLRGAALLARTLYEMEHMIRLLIHDLTGEAIPDPITLPTRQPVVDWDDAPNPQRWPREGLRLTLNAYGLNPEPALVLFVEGKSEETILPWLCSHRLGVDLARFRIEVRGLDGIGGFEGKKGMDRCGSLEKLVDDLHDRQTIAFVLLDNEGRAAAIRRRLMMKRSSRHESRAVTRCEYVTIWNTNFEFDNFSDDEIGAALTRLSEGRVEFIGAEVCAIRCLFGRSSRTLSDLFREKSGYGLKKPDLLRDLAEHCTTIGDPALGPPIAKLIECLLTLAVQNHQPALAEDWEKNQLSGFVGHSLERSPSKLGSLEEVYATLRDIGLPSSGPNELEEDSRELS